MSSLNEFEPKPFEGAEQPKLNNLNAKTTEEPSGSATLTPKEQSKSGHAKRKSIQGLKDFKKRHLDDVSRIEASCADENDECNNAIDESCHSPSPEPLSPAPGVIDVVFNGKPSTLSNFNFNLNLSFDEFIDCLNHCISKECHQPLHVIQAARKTYCYIWMTKARSRQKTLPRYIDFDSEEDYQSLHMQVRSTSRKNRELKGIMKKIPRILCGPQSPETSTSEQKDALASLGESQFAKVRKELLAHLKCDAHSNEKYCWKPGQNPFNGKVHIPLCQRDLELWAIGINNSTATKFSPPENEHFWKLKAKYIPPSPQRGIKRPATPEISPEQIIRIEISQAPYVAYQAAGAPPIKGFYPRDYNGAGLHDFLSWMTRYYEDVEYVELFSVLHEQKLGIDLFKRALHNSTQANKLERNLEKLNVKGGMIDRLMMGIEKWYKG